MHTKGPWYVSEQFEGTQVKVSGPDERGIALVYGDTIEEAQANAHLIATTLELLGALEHCHDTLRGILDDTYIPTEERVVLRLVTQAIKRADEAIREAKGE